MDGHALHLSRRRLLRGGLATGLAVGFGGGLCGVPGQPNVAWAAGDPVAGMRTGTLVVVFLRGGADTLSLMAPADDPDYRAARAPELRVQTDGEAAGLPLAQTLAAGIDFRLHPEAAPLAELYRDRSLAIVHAAGLTDGTRSHFVAQDLIERGVGDEAALTRTGAGWAARWLGDGAADGMAGDRMTLSAMAAGTGVPAALAGHGGTLAVGDLDRGLAPPGGKATAAVLDGLFRGDDGPYARAGRDALAGLAGIDARLPRGADGKIAPYAAEGGAAYETGEAARGLQTVARLVKMEIGLRLAWVDVGGWDTHENQPGRFANAVRGLSRALAAFHADTNRFHDRVTLVVLSEFGRRLRSNRSQGTDHGHGGAMLALGGRVAGGRMLGRWPGLASHQLDRGVDLAVTTDYRAVLAGLVGPAVFPGYAGPGLGLLTA